MNYQSTNFKFLEAEYPDLAQRAIQAERYINDPTICIMNLRQFGELLAQKVAGEEENNRENQSALLRRLRDKGLVNGEIYDLFEEIRIAGNRANHEFTSTFVYQQALQKLKNAHDLAKWYYKLNPQNKNALILRFREPLNLQPSIDESQRHQELEVEEVTVVPSLEEIQNPARQQVPNNTSKIGFFNNFFNHLRSTPLGGKILAVILGLLVIIYFIFPSIIYLLKPKVSVNTLRIGILWTPKSYTKLADYLKEELVPANYFDYITGKKVKVIIDGDKTLSYQEARNRIAAKEWDIAFTISPINSIFAKDKGYQYLAAMFPKNSGYKAGLIVKSDSPIQSINDIKPNTLVALGEFTSASSFYMPSYDLYGKIFSVSVGNRGQKIVEMVKSGKADVGSAAIGDSVEQNDSGIKIIHVSRQIPGSGVYLSPQLSLSDRESIKKVMLAASPEIKKQANYGSEIPEYDYTLFRQIIQRVDTVLVCSDFTKNPVEFFCPTNFIPYQITGKINGGSIEGNDYSLRVAGKDGSMVNVALSKDLFIKINGNAQLNDIQGKLVEIKVPKAPQTTSSGLRVEITQPQQFAIINK